MTRMARCSKRCGSLQGHILRGMGIGRLLGLAAPDLTVSVS